jgi:hypothetical protein
MGQGLPENESNGAEAQVRPLRNRVQRFGALLSLMSAQPLNTVNPVQPRALSNRKKTTDETP